MNDAFEEVLSRRSVAKADERLKRGGRQGRGFASGGGGRVASGHGEDGGVAARTEERCRIRPVGKASGHADINIRSLTRFAQPGAVRIGEQAAHHSTLACACLIGNIFQTDMNRDLVSVRISKPPKRDVALLGKSEPWIMNACLHFSGDMTAGYVEGYRCAAEHLIDHVEKTHTEQDYLVYPILFLYRHHIEIRLKDILGLLHSIGCRTRPPPTCHDLLSLWSECKRDFKNVIGDGQKPWLASVEGCIRQLAAVDPHSDAFRYPTNRKGAKSAESLTHINLTVLRQTMDAILDWLSSVADLLTDYRSNLE